MGAKANFGFILIFWITFQDVISLSLKIVPEHYDKGTGGGNVSVTCNTDEPLTHCQFSRRDIDNVDGPLMDLSKGPLSFSNDQYSYKGLGLHVGHCGVMLNTPAGIVRWVVGCRVRSKNSTWHYGHMTIFSHSKSATGLYLSASQIITSPGANVELTCNKTSSPVALSTCQYRLPDGRALDFSSGSSSTATNLYQYYGLGLNVGACGIRLTGVTKDLNGFVWCQGTTSSSDEWKATSLIVANLRATPTLEVKAGNLTTDIILEASCTALDVPPTAQIIWLLGGQIIKQDYENITVGEPWRWPFQLQTIKRTFTRKLIRSDNGTELVCRVDQVTTGLPPVESTYTINFIKEYIPPSQMELTVNSLDFFLGESLLANCTVIGGYPAPTIMWYFGSRNLAVSTTDRRDDMVILTVSKNVEIEDDGKELKCIAQNRALRQPLEQKKLINVEYPPQVSSRPKDQYKFQVGKPGVAIVEFAANPTPKINWIVDTFTVEEGDIDPTGRFEASFLLQKGNESHRWLAQLFIKNITIEDLHSSFFLNATNKVGGEYIRAVNYQVSLPPDLTEPIVTFEPKSTDIKENSTFTATCTVQSKRAVAIIIWTLNNVTITQGIGKPILSQTDDQGTHIISRNVTLLPKQEDDAKELACIVEDLRTEHIISVMYSPRKISLPFVQYGLDIGKLGVLSLEITANPRPELSWEINGLIIQEGHIDGRFHAAEILVKARDKWEAKLYITKITAEDIATTFLLTARNVMGATTYQITISLDQSMVLSSDLPSSEYSSTMVYTTDDEYQTKSSSASGLDFPHAIILTTKSDASNERSTIVLHAEKNYFQYLSIANAVAILLLMLFIIVVFIRLRTRISRASKDPGRMPICVDNIYEESSCTEGHVLMPQCQDVITGENKDVEENQTPLVTLMPDLESASVTFQQPELPAWKANF